MIDGVNDKISGAHSDLGGEGLWARLRRNAPHRRRTRCSARTRCRELPTSPSIKNLPFLRFRSKWTVRPPHGLASMSPTSLPLLNPGSAAKPSQLCSLVRRKYDIAVRFPESVRGSPDAIGSLTVTLPTGARIPLSQVAQIGTATGESSITREMNRRHLTVRLNLRGRDLSSFLEGGPEERSLAGQI